MAIRPAILLLLVCVYGKLSAQTSCVDSSTVFLLKATSAKISVSQSIPLSDSGILVCGFIRNETQTDTSIFISRFDKFNNAVFNKRLVGFTGYPRKILQCVNGDILLGIAPSVITSLWSQIPYLLRIDINGNIVWQRQMPPTNTAYSIYASYGPFEMFETADGNIYAGTTDMAETDPDQGILSGYYHIYKMSPLGDIIWKTTLVANNEYNNHINSIKEINGEVLVVTQQVNTGMIYCNSPNEKSVGLIKLNKDNGAFVSSRNYCLNFQSNQCGGSGDNYKNSVQILNDGRILIAGQIFICGAHPLYTIVTDHNFQNVSAYWYSYSVPYSIFLGSVHTNPFGETMLFSRGYNNLNILYATILPNGSIKAQRKMEFLSGVTISPGRFAPAFKRPGNFIFFANQAENGQEFLRVTEVKGNNIETSDCTGRDTSFVKSQPHILAPITFAWDTIRTETATTINTNYTLIDFSFNREEICSSISICDSLRITGPGSICLNSPQQLFTAKRNPGCLKVPNWKIDPAAIQSMQTINDSTVTIIFKQAWEGYLYAFNSSCDRLSDSIYIRVLANPVVSIQLGNDTTFCSPVILDAGAGFESYRWQDGSTNRSFTVRHEGIYYVTATDRCNNIFTDTIHFSAKQTELFIGNDSCVQFPYVLTANNGFASYQWQDGSSQPQFMAAMPGIYVVKTTNACNEAFTDTIVLNKKLLAFSLGNDTTICAGRPIHLSAPAGFTAYQWQDNSANNNFTAAAPGTYYVAVNDACGNLISDTITIQPLQLAFTAGNDTLICKKERIVLQASSGFVNYSWQPDYRISNANTMMVWVEPEITTAYRVMAQTNSGCTVTDTILIEVKDCPQYLYIPSAFTPNRDGKNDLFKPSVSGVLEEYEFIVYNRWGQTVFRSTDHRKGWDGTLKGTALDNAVFIWICRYKFPGLPAELKKGTVMLIR